MNLLFVQIPAHMVRGIGIAEGRGGILVPFHFGLLIHIAPTHAILVAAGGELTVGVLLLEGFLILLAGLGPHAAHRYQVGKVLVFQSRQACGCLGKADVQHFQALAVCQDSA